jgi:HPt (histidine-containing phosphotransfer) domain-containing protein
MPGISHQPDAMSRDSRLHAAQGAFDAQVGGAGTGSPAVLDAQALERLRELDPTGQNRLLDRVFGAFEASLARLVPQLDAARGAADWQVVRHVAHTLKSSSASIGALELSRLCAEVETLVRQAEVQGIGERLDAMSAEVARVRDALRERGDEAG